MKEAKAIVNYALRVTGRKVKDQSPTKYKKAIALVENTLTMMKLYRKHKRRKRR